MFEAIRGADRCALHPVGNAADARDGNLRGVEELGRDLELPEIDGLEGNRNVDSQRHRPGIT